MINRSRQARTNTVKHRQTETQTDTDIDQQCNSVPHPKSMVYARNAYIPRETPLPRSCECPTSSLNFWMSMVLTIELRAVDSARNATARGIHKRPRCKSPPCKSRTNTRTPLCRFEMLGPQPFLHSSTWSCLSQSPE